MNDFLKDIEPMPSLSFGEPLQQDSRKQDSGEPLPASAPAGGSAPTKAAQTAPPDDAVLSAAEKAMVESFVSQIDLHNARGILEYGAGTQKKMADFSESTLENVRSKDLGEIGTLLNSVVDEVRGFDEEEKGFLGIFKKSAAKIASVKARYERAESYIAKICSALENHQVTLLKDVAILDKMYELNLTYYKELTMYILAGRKKLAQVRAEELPALRSKAQASGLPEDAQAARDLEELCLRFEKKIHDLDLTRAISMQTAPQIRLIQNNDTQMAEKIQSTLVNTIPLWKNQMVITLGLQHSAQALQAQQAVTDATNELLKKNAAALKTATIDTARATERGVVDIETLKETNASLLSTLDEVLKIQAEGRQKRAAAETELRSMENALREKLLHLNS